VHTTGEVPEAGTQKRCEKKKEHCWSQQKSEKDRKESTSAKGDQKELIGEKRKGRKKCCVVRISKKGVLLFARQVNAEGQGRTKRSGGEKCK